MSTYTTSLQLASRPFIVTPYCWSNGRMSPAIPSCCIASGGGGEGCSLCEDHWRERKTGPCHPLLVLRCRVHECAFTLYPAGHVPYGRRAVAPASLDGQAIADDGIGEWETTVFKAAVDAANGRVWDREREWGSYSWWSSQCRLLSLCLDLLGISPDLDEEARHLLAEVLGVDTLLLHEKARVCSVEAGYRSRGAAVVEVLRGLPQNGRLERILVTGFLVERWGPPLRWEVGAGGVMRVLAFPPSGTDPPDENPRRRFDPRK